MVTISGKERKFEALLKLDTDSIGLPLLFIWCSCHLLGPNPRNWVEERAVVMQLMHLLMRRAKCVFAQLATAWAAWRKSLTPVLKLRAQSVQRAMVMGPLNQESCDLKRQPRQWFPVNLLMKQRRALMSRSNHESSNLWGEEEMVLVLGTAW